MGGRRFHLSLSWSGNRHNNPQQDYFLLAPDINCCKEKPGHTPRDSDIFFWQIASDRLDWITEIHQALRFVKHALFADFQLVDLFLYQRSEDAKRSNCKDGISLINQCIVTYKSPCPKYISFLLPKYCRYSCVGEMDFCNHSRLDLVERNHCSYDADSYVAVAGWYLPSPLLGNGSIGSIGGLTEVLVSTRIHEVAEQAAEKTSFLGIKIH